MIIHRYMCPLCSFITQVGKPWVTGAYECPSCHKVISIQPVVVLPPFEDEFKEPEKKPTNGEGEKVM